MRDGVSSFLSAAGAGFVSGVAAALTLSFGAFILQDPIARLLSQMRPTCDQPAGLVQVDNALVTASGPVAATHTEEEAGPQKVLDGYAGSMWIPPSVHSPGTHVAVFEAGGARLDLKFPKTEVKLICVNNGIASSTFAYRNHGKARTVEVWTGEDASATTLTTLASQPSDSMQQLQVVGRNLEAADTLSIQLDDAHYGETLESFDPDHCGQSSTRIPVAGGETVQLRYERGCFVAATPIAGLSEVVLYEDAE